MATFLDIGLFSHFGPVFIVLVVFLLLFGMLEYIKVFGEGKRGLHALISMVIALMFLIYKVPSLMISMMVPWFVVFIIFIFFALLMVRMFAHGEADIKKLLGDPNVYPFLIIILVLILFLALGNAFGQSLLSAGSGGQTTTVNSSTGGYTGSGLDSTSLDTTSTATPSFTTNLLNTLRHPKVLGLLFVFLVGAFTLLLLTKTPSSL
jgi:hypothetical protein